jgi:hypothetical protein
MPGIARTSGQRDDRTRQRNDAALANPEIAEVRLVLPLPLGELVTDNRRRFLMDRDRKSADETTLDDPLGIQGVPVPHSDRIRASNDEAAVRRRRKRAGLGPDGDDRTTDGMGDLDRDPQGAASIDMGAGGTGNTIRDESKD